MMVVNVIALEDFLRFGVSVCLSVCPSIFFFNKRGNLRTESSRESNLSLNERSESVDVPFDIANHVWSTSGRAAKIDFHYECDMLRTNRPRDSIMGSNYGA